LGPVGITSLRKSTILDSRVPCSQCPEKMWVHAFQHRKHKYGVCLRETQAQPHLHQVVVPTPRTMLDSNILHHAAPVLEGHSLPPTPPLLRRKPLGCLREKQALPHFPAVVGLAFSCVLPTPRHPPAAHRRLPCRSQGVHVTKPSGRPLIGLHLDGRVSTPNNPWEKARGPVQRLAI